MIIISLLFITLFIAFFAMLYSGLHTDSRVNVEESVTLTPLPEDLDYYLSEQEKKFPDIKANTEKIIIWHNPLDRTKTRLAMVYLHGYSASRQEISPVTETLAKIFSANLFLTRLTGHGRASDAMQEVSLNALLKDAKEALDIGTYLGEKVILIGCSTGATLATWLASQYPEQVHAIILLSPNFGLKQKKTELLLWPWPQIFVRLLQGKNYEFESSNEQQARYWTTRYPSEALIPMMKLVKLIRQKSLKKIRHPTLVLYCPDDQVVNVSMIKENLSRFGSRQITIDTIEPVENRNRHVLCGDILSPASNNEVITKIEEFLKNETLVP